MARAKRVIDGYRTASLVAIAREAALALRCDTPSTARGWALMYVGDWAMMYVADPRETEIPKTLRRVRITIITEDVDPKPRKGQR